jgi:YD repeat-containing protein
MSLSLKSVVFAGFLAVFCQTGLLAQADFSFLPPNPTSQTVWQAQNTSYLITVTAINGFAGTVTFSTSGLPTGATAAFSPATVVGSGTTTMTVTASPGTPTGSSNVTLTGTSAPLTHNTNVTLNVVVPPPITYTYDAAGRLTSVTDQWGNSAIYSYDAVGNLLSIARPINPPIISTFSPTSGVTGTSVVIQGAGYSSTPAQNTVKFNGVTATVTSSTATQIVTTVPVGATTGPIAVTVSGNTATSSSSFTVIATPSTPTISSINPTLASSAVPLTITGTNFFTNAASDTVKIGPTTLNVLSATATSISAVTPTVVSSGKITVQTPSGLSLPSNQDFIAIPAPFRVSDLVLSQRAIPGTNYTMNFTASGQAGVLIFDGVPGQTAKLLTSTTIAGYSALTLYGPDGAILMNGVVLGNAAATLTTPTLTAGTYTALIRGPVTSVFIGSTSFAAGKTGITILSAPAAGDFVLTTLSELFQNYEGGSVYYSPNFRSGQRFRIFVAMGSGLNVSLSATGLPTGVTSAFSPPSVSSDGVSMLEFTVADSVPPGTYPITINGSAGALTHGVTIQLKVVPPPSPWLQTSINVAGRGEYDSGVFTIVGAGSGNLFFTDAFQYVYQPLTADGTIVARVTGIDHAPTNIGPTAYAGVMIRETLTADSNVAYLRLRTTGGVEFQWRTSTGGSLNSVVAPGIIAPYWLKIARQGSNFTALMSPDGTNWTQVGLTVAITMASPKIGLATGADNFGGLDQAIFDNVVVNTAADFLLTATPQTQSVIPGNATSFTTNVAALSGFSTGVTLSASGWPAGASGTFAPNPVTGSGTSTLSVTTTGATPPGVFPITISGVGAPGTRTVVATLVTAPDFTMSVNPAPPNRITANVGSTGNTYAVSVNFTPGLTTPVNLTVAGVPPAATASFSPAQLSASGNSTLTLNIGASTPAAAYTLTIIGKSGTSPNIITHTITALLTVSQTGFSIQLNPTLIQYQSTGGSSNSTVTVSASNNFSKVVTLSATSLPAGATASFNPQSVAPGVPSTLTITMPGGLAPGSYPANIVGTAVDPSTGNPSSSSPISLVVNPAGSAPSGWASIDVGSPSVPGATGFSGTTFTVQSAGSGNGSSAYRFVYQSLTGTGSIIASVGRLQNLMNGAYYGLTVRDPALDSRSAALLVRDTNLSSILSGGGPDQSGPVFQVAPVWLKLTRAGDVITGSTSVDGFVWTQLGSPVTLSGLSQTVNIGMMIGANVNQTDVTTADFFDVTVLGAAADFDLTISPNPTKTISTNGGSVYGTARITGVNGFSGNSTISVTGLPTGGTYSLSSPTVAVGGYVNLQINLPSGLSIGPYLVTITATSGSLNHSVALPLTVTSAAGLPSLWASDDIVPLALPGSSSVLGSTWSINSSGDQISGNIESFHYTYQRLTGDGTMVVRLVDFGTYYPYPAARLGVMARETLEPDSPNAFITIRGNGSLYPTFQYRSTKGGNSVENQGSQQITSQPNWLKLQRASNQFTGWVSSDGVDWTQINSISLTLPQTIFIGLATTSGRTDRLTLSTFDNTTLASSPTASADFYLTAAPISQTIGTGGGSASYTVDLAPENAFTGTVNLSFSGLPTGATGTTASITTSGSTILSVTTSGAPAGTYPISITGTNGSITRSVPVTLLVNSSGGSTLPSPWSHMDIGAVGVIGDASYASGSFTVKGSGQYIFYSSDQFQYAYQTLAGDGTIIAHIASTQNLTGTAKVGVMIRETLAPGSTHVLVARQPGPQFLFQHRDTAETQPVYSTAGDKPWFKLVRQGNQFTAFASSDGFTWGTALGTVTIAMRNSVYIGLAVGSENNSSATTAVFDNVSIAGGNDFRLLATPASRTIGQASSTTYTINVDPLNGFGGPITPFSVSGLPAGATSSFSPTTWSGSGTVTLTVNTASTTPVGSYPLVISGTGAGLTRTTTATLGVGTFTIAATPSSQTTYLSTTANYAITVTSVGGFNSQVNLSASGNPAHTTVAINPTSVTPSANGTATATLTVTTQGNTAAGTSSLTITAISGITLTTSVSLTVSTTPTYTMSISPASATVQAGNSATYTVTVNRFNGFTSAVNMVGVDNLPSGATATFNPATIPSGSTTSTLTVATTRTTTVGTSNLTVNGNISGNTMPRSVGATLQVNPPADFTLTPSPNSRTVTAGTSAVYAINVTSSQFLNSAVTLTASGLPANATASFNPSTVTSGSGQSTLTITTTGVAAGTSNVTVTGTNGSGGSQFTHQVGISLTVGAGADFAITGTPVRQFAAVGQAATFTLGVEPANGFSGAVMFTVTGLPPSAGGTFSPNPVNGSGTTTFSVTVPGGTAAGSYSLTFTGTSGGLSHTYPATLVVIDKDFSITAVPTSGSPPLHMLVETFGSWSYDLTAVPTNGFSSAVQFSVSGGPACATYTPPASPVAPNTTTNLYVTVTNCTAANAGHYTLTVTGTADSGMTRTTTAAMYLTNYSAYGVPASQTVARGSSGTYTIGMDSADNWYWGQNLSILSGLPNRVTAVFNPTTLDAFHLTSTLTLTVASNATVGTYNIVVQEATQFSATPKRQTTITLVIQ